LDLFDFFAERTEGRRMMGEALGWFLPLAFAVFFCFSPPARALVPVQVRVEI
jgi:hypothetical protein